MREIWSSIWACSKKYDDGYHSFDLENLACFTLKEDDVEDRLLDLEYEYIDPYIYDVLIKLNRDLKIFTWVSCSGLVEDHIYGFPYTYWEMTEPYIGFNGDSDLVLIGELVKNTLWTISVNDYCIFIHAGECLNDKETKDAWARLEENLDRLCEL